jgi:hypothetical protein
MFVVLVKDISAMRGRSRNITIIKNGYCGRAVVVGVAAYNWVDVVSEAVIAAAVRSFGLVA